MDRNELIELIKKFKAGTATPEEVARLEKMWAEASDDSGVSADHTPIEFDRIQGEMFINIQQEIRRSQNPKVRSITPLIYKIAASILILVAFAVAWYANTNSMVEIKTAFGEHRFVTLPDSSTVQLNGNSALKYANNWDSQKSREVWIEGEGFFSVTHTLSHQKFIVHGMEEFNVEVLGTKFNIRTRDSKSQVVLTEGSLRVVLNNSTETKEVLLKPGDLATVHNKDLSKQPVKHHEYTSWMDNKLFFERTPLRDVAAMLQDTYGLTVVFETPGLEERELSGEISSATADDILLAISETFDLKISREGDSATISKK